MVDWDVPADAALDRLIPRSTTRFPRRFFGSVRLVTRLVEALTIVHAGYARPLLIVVGACALIDIRMSPWAGRRGRGPLAVRLMLDAVDVALWAIALHGAADVAAVSATPLAFEFGFWCGPWFLVVPALVGTVTTLALPAAGYPPNVLVYLWPTVWGAIGMLAAFTLRAKWRGEVRAVQDRVDAAVSEAELSGQNSVAMGADSVVDLLMRTEVLLTSYEPKPRPSECAGWKAKLAESCARRSTYLGTALIRWQRRYNGCTPDLLSDVELRIRPGAGTLMLSSDQATRLYALLDEMAPRGVVAVDVPELGTVGREQVVVIGGTSLVLAADTAPRPTPLQVAPGTFVMGVFLILAHSLPQWEGVPLWATLPLAGLAAVAARVAQRRSADPAADVARLGIAMGLGIGAADAVISTLLMRAGCTRLPFLFFLQWFGPLFFAYARDLRPGQRLLAAAGTTAAVCAGMLVMPVNFTALGVLLAVPWLVNPVLIVHGMRRLLDEDAAGLRDQMERHYDASVSEAFDHGRRLVVDLTAAAIERMRARCDALGPAIPSSTAAEIRRRLDEAVTLLSPVGACDDEGPAARPATDAGRSADVMVFADSPWTEMSPGRPGASNSSPRVGRR